MRKASREGRHVGEYSVVCVTIQVPRFAFGTLVAWLFACLHEERLAVMRCHRSADERVLAKVSVCMRNGRLRRAVPVLPMSVLSGCLRKRASPWGKAVF